MVTEYEFMMNNRSHHALIIGLLHSIMRSRTHSPIHAAATHLWHFLQGPSPVWHGTCRDMDVTMQQLGASQEAEEGRHA